MSKKRKCLHCKKKHNRFKALYCSEKCAYKAHKLRTQESYKMDFKDGHRHEAANAVDDFAITTHSVPHNILQEAKNHYDHTNSLYYEGEKIVEDVEKIMITTRKILAETLTKGSQVIKKRRLARKMKLIKNDEYISSYSFPNGKRHFNKFFSDF
tara:strand:- start:115 stop:576 length:462 start_codon:yes stop_codon:yes gene_type:complete